MHSHTNQENLTGGGWGSYKVVVGRKAWGMGYQLTQIEKLVVLDYFKGIQTNGVFLIVTISFFIIALLAETILLCYLAIIERRNPFSGCNAGYKEETQI